MFAEVIGCILIVYALAFLAFVGRGSSGLSPTRTLSSADVAKAVRDGEKRA